MLCTNMVHFSELNQLPMPIDLGCLDEGNGMKAAMINNQAVWYKSC